MPNLKPASDFPLNLGVILYENFELLDVYGPLEMFGLLPQHFSLIILAEHDGFVASTQGPKTVVEQSFSKAEQLDILLVPGGRGSFNEVKNPVILEFLRLQERKASIVASVCTGSSILAQAGLLDGKNATTNKLYFERMKPFGPKVNWIPEARWVEDDKFFTSSGVSAGIDMSLAIITQLLGREVALKVADGAEYLWNEDSSYDPFAKLHGLI